MSSIAYLPENVRMSIFSFLSATSRLYAVTSNSWMFVGSSAEKPVGVCSKAKLVREVLDPLVSKEMKYPLIPELTEMTYMLCKGGDDNFCRDAPTWWGLSRSDQESEVLITEWLIGVNGQRFTCPFHGWLTINDNDPSVKAAVDMLHYMDGKMRFFTSKSCIVLTFADADSGIEGSCFAACPFIDSDDASSKSSGSSD